MMSTRFIVDTNALVAGVITSEPSSSTARVLNAMLDGSLVYILSGELLREYRCVLLRTRIVAYHGLLEQEIDQLLTEITANACWCEPFVDLDHPAPDPQDCHLWALLAAEQKAVLITGDRLLLEKPPVKGSTIFPAAWVEHFERQSREL